ncbi:acylglycerol kinase family protein [Anaerobacillus sp. CMMVII]|uniref:diacylglycerol/lipid kinase family protein n=1 Tax=Anaerobacillus sp. CMMVII TaxID=2755588 RepID=UPI0021B72C87|nr:acylglycerol kinase family protein [Anaerobacillus sp. CMMVII]MCT8138967.1 acylglycerol kinase family protein [Anaerobacillus sp. CMMVII]
MYLFIINNHSGKGTKVWKKVLPLLDKWDIQYKSYFITKPEEMLEFNLDINSIDTKALVVVGGDGTIHHALKYIENTAIPLGVIPAGSGNDFARALNIPKNSHLALLKILEGKLQHIDLLKVNNHSCATVVGVGFDANVAQLVNQSRSNNGSTT